MPLLQVGVSPEAFPILLLRLRLLRRRHGAGLQVSLAISLRTQGAAGSQSAQGLCEMKAVPGMGWGMHVLGRERQRR
jgi:hypothetical protein